MSMFESRTKIDPGKVPLAFSEGAILKKGARWNQEEILSAGTEITDGVIREYEDVALYIPISLKIDSSLQALEALIEENIRKYREKKKADKVKDLSEDFDEGDVLFKQGDETNQDCFFLTEGSVHVYRDQKLLVTITETGVPLGEMSFLTGEPRSASLVAAEPSKLLRIKKEDLKDLLRNNPTIISTLLNTLVNRLNATSAKLVDAEYTLDTAYKQLEEIKAQSGAMVAAVSGQASPDAEAIQKELEVLQGKYRTLAQYIEKEVGVKAGNTKIFVDIARALQQELEAAVLEGPAKKLQEALQGYLAYLESQPASKVITPITHPESMSPALKSLIQDEDA